MSTFHSFAAFARRRLEALLFLLLFPFWLLLALAAWLYGKWLGISGGGLFLTDGLKRWRILMTRGAGFYREAWWMLFQLEPAGCWWRHLVLTEFFAAMNCRGRVATRPESKPRIVLLQFAHVGDALHTRPLADALVGQFGPGQVDVVTSSWLTALVKRWPSIGYLAAVVPGLRQYNRGGARATSVWAWIRLGLHLRAKGYRYVIAANPVSPVEWMVIQACCPEAWIGTTCSLSGTYTAIASSSDRFDTGMYEAKRLMQLVRHTGGNPVNAKLRYEVTEAELREADKKLREAGWAGERPILLVSPGGGRMDRCWPAERYREVLAALRQQRGVFVVLIGTREEKSYAGAIAGDAAGVINLAGETSLFEAAAMIDLADFFLGNDSGPFHLAIALEKPAVGLFRSSQRARWAPPDNYTDVRIVEEPYDCRGCLTWHPDGVCVHDSVCVRGIPSALVLNACMDLITNQSSGGVGV